MRGRVPEPPSIEAVTEKIVKRVEAIRKHRARGGLPIPLPHVPTGLLKLAVQASGLPGGDGCVLLAFRANEWQSREKYARYAARPYTPELAALVQRHAEDEARHYA